MDKQVAFRRISSYCFLLIGFSIAIMAGSKLWNAALPVQAIGLACFSVASIGYLVWRGHFHRAAIPRTGLEMGVIAIYVVILMTWIVSIDQREGLERVILLVTYGVIFYLLVDAFDIGLDRDALFAALLTVTAFLLIAALLETSSVYRDWWQRVGGYQMPPHPYRFVGMLGHPNALMAVANLAAPIAVVGFLQVRQRIVRMLLALWIVLYVLAIYFSSSRGAVLGLVAWASVLALAALSARRGEHGAGWLRGITRRWRGLFVVIAIVTILIVVLAVVLLSRHPSHGLNPFSSRAPIWQTALDIWLRSPFIGAGPGRFPFAYLAANPSIPPDYWATQAHNVFLQATGESGILGLLVLVGFSVILTRVALPRGKTLSTQPYQAAVLAALVAFLAQSLVDEFSQWVSIMVPMLTLAAWFFSDPDERIVRFASVRMYILFVPIASIIFVAGFRLWAYTPAWSAIKLGNQGEHALAARQVTLSASRDPNIFYYTQQAGMRYADAWYASRDPIDLELARSYLHRALQLEPGFSWLWANLAALDWFSYDLDSARLNIQRAIQASPSAAVYYLNAGWFAEQVDDFEGAGDHYQQTLQFKPEWATHPFWTMTPERLTWISEWQKDNSVVPSASYWYAAQSALTRGDHAQAERLLAYAAWLGEPRVCILQVRAQAAAAAGDQPSTERHLNELLAVMENRNIDSGNPLAETLANWVYQRAGIPNDLVPGVINLTGDCGQFESVERYAGILREQGRCAEAARVWDALQQARRGGAREVLPPAPECGE